MKLSKRHFLIKVIIFIYLFFINMRIAISSPQTDYHASYTVHYGDFSLGHLNRNFKMNQKHYDLSLISESSVLFYKNKSEEKSEGIWINNNIYPKCFLQKINEKENNFYFSSANLKKIRFSNKIIENTPIYDELSYQLALQQDLTFGKKDFKYLVLQNNKIKKYEFKIIGEENLDTPIGKISTIKIMRINYIKSATTFWLGKDYGYIPVALKQIRANKPEVNVIIESLDYKK